MPHFSDMYHFFYDLLFNFEARIRDPNKNQTSGCSSNRFSIQAMFLVYVDTLMRQEGQWTLPFRCPVHYESQARNPAHNTA